MSTYNLQLIALLEKKMQHENASEQEVQYCRTLIELVKKDTPIEVNAEPCAIWGNIKIHCPRCNSLSTYNSTSKIRFLFCENCGQRLMTKVK